MVPDVTIPRPFKGARLGYPLPEGVWGGWHQGTLGDDRVLPREVFESSHEPARLYEVAYVLLRGV
jgi:hypothetical protein